MKQRWIGLTWLLLIVYCFFSWWFLLNAIFGSPTGNSVVYKLGTEDASEQIYFYDDPNDLNHQSDRIFIGSDSDHFILIEVQYNVTLADICRYWLTDEPLADFNKDKIVNFIDYAIWAVER